MVRRVSSGKGQVEQGKGNEWGRMFVYEMLMVQDRRGLDVKAKSRSEAACTGMLRHLVNVEKRDY